MTRSLRRRLARATSGTACPACGDARTAVVVCAIETEPSEPLAPETHERACTSCGRPLCRVALVPQTSPSLDAWAAKWAHLATPAGPSPEKGTTP